MTISYDLNEMRERLARLGWWSVDSARAFSYDAQHCIPVRSNPSSEQRLSYYHNVYKLSPLARRQTDTADLARAA